MKKHYTGAVCELAQANMQNLIEQLESMTELVLQLKEAQANVSDKMGKENMRLREALSFYADASNYHIADYGRNYQQKLVVESYDNNEPINKVAIDALAETEPEK